MIRNHCLELNLMTRLMKQQNCNNLNKHFHFNRIIKSEFYNQMEIYLNTLRQFCVENDNMNLRAYYLRDAFSFVIQGDNPKAVQELLQKFLLDKMTNFDTRIITMCSDHFIQNNLYTYVVQIVELLNSIGKVTDFDFNDIVHKILVKGEYKTAEKILLLQPYNVNLAQTTWEDYIEQLAIAQQTKQIINFLQEAIYSYEDHEGSQKLLFQELFNCLLNTMLSFRQTEQIEKVLNLIHSLKYRIKSLLITEVFICLAQKNPGFARIKGYIIMFEHQINIYTISKLMKRYIQRKNYFNLLQLLDMCLKGKDKIYCYSNIPLSEYDQKFIMVLLYTRMQDTRKQKLDRKIENDTDSFVNLSKEMSHILELISLDKDNDIAYRSQSLISLSSISMNSSQKDSSISKSEKDQSIINLGSFSQNPSEISFKTDSTFTIIEDPKNIEDQK